MITYREAQQLIFKHAPRMASEPCKLADTQGRILREPINSDRAYPPYDRVMMDGYALAANNLGATGRFQIRGLAAAGKQAAHLHTEQGTCLEVMTGAPLPTGANCVVPYELTTRIADNEITIHPSFLIAAGSNIHGMGTDVAANTLILKPGTPLGPVEIGIAATCGVTSLQVSRQPLIRILPTGDELVDVEVIPAPHQIRQSNGHATRAALLGAGFSSQLSPPLSDDTQAYQLEALFKQGDWIIFTGAISKGTRDFLPRILSELGCEKIFHGVAHRPGKPAGFWLGPNGQAIIALPGNPVSALIGLYTLVLPGLAVSVMRNTAPPRLIVPTTLTLGLENMTQHLPVSLTPDGRALPAPTGNSGDFTGLINSDGFITIPARNTPSAAYPYTPWR